MMSEPHLFALANLLQCSIIVVDTRFRVCRTIMHYRPGYVVSPPLSLVEARLMIESEPTCVWVRLHAAHFRALSRVIDVC